MVATYALGVVLVPKYIEQGTALKISAVLGIISVSYTHFRPNETKAKPDCRLLLEKKKND